ncbi:nucleotidyltransferase [Clostridium botulinum]|uniref:Cyclic GMP-AMP synthase n=1 Tax=Clostridium botulinum TaxID=1491 RepID=A0A0L9Y448_CLOBO|nr:hypothetical protein [Clostridium botulinum]KAI3349985.1 nucleotidyltransferase [Clostridium botulinum]KOM86587.1 hypothetical protein ACP51_17400 [Clostridium botulinum]KOR55321.1 hypothetical protein ADT22_17075 [Clostridium botulinum]NFA41581.1 nucleotidyltransferase [Clostridium botulinum]NFR81385.1 nucleotidyltransferase [Clostridium botulinum]
MYNLDKEIRSFYRKKVVLSSEKQKSLIEKKDLNLDRLKAGLKEYNEENGTDYKIVDTIIQGSVAMQTVIQAEDNNYDIDVGIAFNKDNLPQPITSENNTQKVKNIVHSALLKKATVFKFKPEKRTNCIRVIYSDGYHIDFAIYRRYKDENDEYIYEHCGADWVYRNPRTITKWFKSRDKAYNYNLKRIVRLLKAYLKQDSSWSVPGGLIQSVLADECFKSSSRLDEMLYNTIEAIVNRLEENTEVNNPVDKDSEGKEIPLLRTQEHKDKVIKMKNYIKKGLNKLSILFDGNECTEEKALRAWGDFFNNDYWTELADEISNTSIAESINKSFSALNQDVYDYNETEEFIEELYPINEKYNIDIECKVQQSGYTVDTLRNFLRFNKYLKPNKKLYFEVKNNTVPRPYKIYWKVLNAGNEAMKRNEIRGQIVKGDRTHTEDTLFSGNHKVYCYIVKNEECVAMNDIDVPIYI